MNKRSFSYCLLKLAVSLVEAHTLHMKAISCSRQREMYKDARQITAQSPIANVLFSSVILASVGRLHPIQVINQLIKLHVQRGHRQLSEVLSNKYQDN